MTVTTSRVLKVTPARGNAWVDCRRAYWHKYVGKTRPAGEPWAHLVLGNAVHQALAEWTALPFADRTQAAAGRLLDAAWSSDGFRDRDHADAWLERAQGWVHAYTGRHRDVQMLGSERSVACRYGESVVLEGRADRVDDRDGTLVIVDYKTGRHPSTDADAAGSWALALYCLTVGRMYKRRCARAELHHLPTGGIAVVEYDRDRILRQVDRLVDVLREAAGVEATYWDVTEGGATPGQAAEVLYPTRVGPLCGSCSFRDTCPDGQTVPAAGPWKYLDEPTGDHT